jgi:hypothetical protein
LAPPEAPDFDALDALYRLDRSAPAPEEGAKHNVFLATIDGIRVTFTKDAWFVKAVVE